MQPGAKVQVLLSLAERGVFTFEAKRKTSQTPAPGNQKSHSKNRCFSQRPSLRRSSPGGITRSATTPTRTAGGSTRPSRGEGGEGEMKHVDFQEVVLLVVC